MIRILLKWLAVKDPGAGKRPKHSFGKPVLNRSPNSWRAGWNGSSTSSDHDAEQLIPAVVGLP